MVTFTLMVHNTGNTADSYSATIVGANGPIQAYLVGFDGSLSQTISDFRMTGLSTEAITLQVTAAQLAQGSVTVLVQSLTKAGINATATANIGTNVQQNTPPPPPPPGVVDGPEVTLVQRFGYHEMPTTFVLTFDQALDATTADDARNYEIIGPRGRHIRVKSAVYNAANDTVTLRPVERINVHFKYTLIVDGAQPSGLANVQGKLLDGERTGQPGSNYRTALTWRNVVLEPLPRERIQELEVRNDS